jgi:tripartite-type tricarboxylate transporter receptor subunit TctC
MMQHPDKSYPKKSKSKEGSGMVMLAKMRSRFSGASGASVCLAALILISVVFGSSVGRAQSDGYPNKPIRIEVPVGAGGFQDVVTRAFAEKMSTNLGQPIIVENRPSAGSILGTQFTARAAPDGYTLLAISNTFAITPSLVPTAGYDAIKDFTGVGLTVNSPLLVVVSAASDIKSLADLIAQAKQNPGRIAYASGGTGSTSHIPAEMFLGEAGIRMIHVPYKGNAPAMADVITQRVAFIYNPIIASIGSIKSNQLRAIAITSDDRSPMFPDVPTLRESGFPNAGIMLWAGLVAPAGTPEPIIQRLQAALNAAKQDAQLKATMQDGGQEIAPAASPAEFNAFLRDEVAKYARVINERQIKAE